MKKFLFIPLALLFVFFLESFSKKINTTTETFTLRALVSSQNNLAGIMTVNQLSSGHYQITTSTTTSTSEDFCAAFYQTGVTWSGNTASFPSNEKWWIVPFNPGQNPQVVNGGSSGGGGGSGNPPPCEFKCYCGPTVASNSVCQITDFTTSSTQKGKKCKDVGCSNPDNNQGNHCEGAMHYGVYQTSSGYLIRAESITYNGVLYQ